MLGFIKSLGSKAITSIPGFSSKTKIITPEDPYLEDKLKQISTLILKAQEQEQFKVYQQLQSVENADFNRNLRKIYQYEGCNTETINCIIKFYTFLLTNSKNQLVICKLLSEPLVIELTKIVLQFEKNKEEENTKDAVTADCLESGQEGSGGQAAKSKNNQAHEQKQSEESTSLDPSHPSTLIQQISQNNLPDKKQQAPFANKSQPCSTSLHYLNDIDWDEVNAYKVALIRSYINCINPETIKYMIVDNQLPIFVNCVNGYKHYLSEGVEGTCLSNCILMILTKVNHNDEVCEIIFDPEHHSKTYLGQSDHSLNQKYEVIDLNREKLAKSISNQKSMKLDIFVKQVIKKISIELNKVLQNLSQELGKCQDNFVEKTLKPFRKLDVSMEFIESNILFCVDLINSINNYNYTAKIKNNIGESIETQLIGKIVAYVSNFHNQSETNLEKNLITQSLDLKLGNEHTHKLSTPFQLTIVKLMKFVLALSITCQKESMMVEFLNKNSPLMLQTLIDLNNAVFTAKGTDISQNPLEQNLAINQMYSKECITYLCDFALVLLKQTVSPYSKLASRKRLEISQQILELKENLLSKIFILLEQVTKSEGLKEGVCFKAVRNMLLCVFYLTIKEDKCALSSSPKKEVSLGKSLDRNLQSTESKMDKNERPGQVKTNLGLILQFKYSILVLHKIFSEQFKKVFVDNKNWQFIVNNYESLMRQVPNSILSAEESDKYCHYHNGHNYPDEDRIRDRIMICEAVRNYRYMIIHETKLQDRLIRLENIYHKHFMSPGWDYQPGEIAQFSNSDEFKVVCVGLLHNNNLQKLPIQIIQDFECLLISHKIAQNKYKLIANIRYKKIQSFVPQNKNLIRMKLIGIQELILEFSSSKVLTTFKEYLNENRNKTREKELKFINYYLNMYLKDTSKLIEEMYNQDLVGLETESEVLNEFEGESTLKLTAEGSPLKKLSLDNIQVQSFAIIEQDQIPQQNNQPLILSEQNDILKQKELSQTKTQPEEIKIEQATETEDSINPTVQSLPSEIN